VLLERLLFLIDKGKADDLKRACLKKSLLKLKYDYEIARPYKHWTSSGGASRCFRKCGPTSPDCANCASCSDPKAGRKLRGRNGTGLT
jgi:hypothetical protein